MIEPHDLPDYMAEPSFQDTPPSVAAVFNNEVGFNEAVDLYQRSLILYALNQTGWVKAKAAEILKINRTTLVEKIKKMNILPESDRPIF
jgi:DNA-binding NtrC family response regulator